MSLSMELKVAFKLRRAWRRPASQQFRIALGKVGRIIARRDGIIGDTRQIHGVFRDRASVGGMRPGRRDRLAGGPCACRKQGRAARARPAIPIFSGMAGDIRSAASVPQGQVRVEARRWLRYDEGQ